MKDQESERVCHVIEPDDEGKGFVIEERQVARDPADDGIPDELADLSSSHPDLAELARIDATLAGLNERLEDPRVSDRRNRHRDRVRQSLGNLVQVQLSGQVGGLSCVTEDRTNGGEEQNEVDLVQVNEFEDDVENVDYGLVHVVEVLLSQVRKRRVPRNDGHQHDPTEGSDGLGSLDESGHARLVQGITRDCPGITALVIDVPEIQLADSGEELAATTRGGVYVTCAVIEHPDCDSNTQFAASTDQEVYLARIE